MIKKFFRIIREQLKIGYTSRLLLFIFTAIIIGFFATESSVRAITSAEILQEKQVMLFGLATQLDNALVGTYDDILMEHNAVNLPRIDKIKILNEELKQVTDFVASGVPGVGVGYYSKNLDAIITYGPEDQFSHTIGQSIFEGHRGYQVMDEGIRLVQQGELVRGRILNCMHPIIRSGEVIGYIWANETLENVSSQLSSVFSRILIFTVIIFLLLSFSVLLPTWYFNRRIDQLINNIDDVMEHPRMRLPKISGPLESVVSGFNNLLDKVFYFKSHNEYIFDSLQSGIFAVSTEREVLLANPAFRAFLEIEEENLLGIKIERLFPEDFCSYITGQISAAEPQVDSNYLYRGRIYEVVVDDVLNDSGKQIGHVFIFRDRTLLRLYERRLQDQQRLAALGEIGITIAHEIKNPLTSVKGFTQLINRRLTEDEKTVKYLKLMEDELNRIDKLLNEMMVTGKASVFHPEPANIEDMLNEVMVIYSSNKPDIDFTLDCRISGASIVNIDKDKISQLIDNIIKNAVEAVQAKHFADKKEISIYVEKNEDELILKIRDTGVGISEENTNRITTPFFTTKDDGTGLGMSTCLGIVDKHRGRMEIFSEEGEFTEVKITFELNKLEMLNEA
ncbi:MAG: ATP-binding protein [Spirochaetales bacterium]|uniref:histidine kinase n=1 Tax=Candidatus Thalassospirochaeta sargassi TaxID=3119039 RepID=A0AAJ1IF49_9SPIO|nr:ATP-binding protein [Spirochaetales bacterium]